METNKDFERECHLMNTKLRSTTDKLNIIKFDKEKTEKIYGNKVNELNQKLETAEQIIESTFIFCILLLWEKKKKILKNENFSGQKKTTLFAIFCSKKEFFSTFLLSFLLQIVLFKGGWIPSHHATENEIIR